MRLLTKKLGWIAPRQVLAGVGAERGTILGESVRGGRFSIFTAQPIAVATSWRGFQKLIADLPQIKSQLPFVGGLAGVLHYELAHEFEKFPRAPDKKLPRLWFGFYDSGLIFDHAQRELTAFGWSQSKLAAAVEWRAAVRPSRRAKPTHQPRIPKISSNFSRAQYLTAVRKIQKLIVSGHTFQVNFSQRFSLCVAQSDAVAIYEKLCRANPAPFAGFCDAGGFQVLSSSPELLFRVVGQRIEMRPIAGTRPRGRTRSADARLACELRKSVKENAEHAMLIDLARNDLGRVCRFGSVKVETFARIEKYARVQHLVSRIGGELAAGTSVPQILRAVFPGGTITGCPKVETLKIITAFEKSARGPYTGSLGFVSANGRSEFNILIRTLVLHAGRLSWSAGGGIVADSDPAAEYEESLHKAAALFAAVLS